MAIKCIFYHFNELPKCLECGKVILNYSKSSPHKYCSKVCANKNVFKVFNKNLEQKYGVKNISQLSETKEKKKQTCLKHFGTICNSQTDENKEKVKHTCLRRYGSEYYFKSDDFKNKAQDTWKNNYNIENMTSPFQSPIIQQKSVDTLKQKYNVINAGQMEEHKSKVTYKYKENIFNSADELIYFLDNENRGISRNKKYFEYEFENILYRCFPDFVFPDGHLVEIKGNQFLTPDGKWYCPFKDKSWADEEYQRICEKYEAKHQCLLQNGVEIVYTSSLLNLRQKYKGDIKKYGINKGSNK